MGRNQSCAGSTGSGLVEYYKELAAAVVKHAASDYVKALRGLMREGISDEKRKSLTHEKEEVERFFRSGWYELLVDIDPDHLMKGCRMLAWEKEKKRLKN